MKDYFKNDKVSCLYTNNCKNKSNSFCKECSRNFNRVVRDWFEPNDEYNYFSKKLEQHKCNITDLKEDKIKEYSLKHTKLTEEEEDLLIDCFKDN